MRFRRPLAVHQREHWRRASGSSRAIAGLQPAAHPSAARHGVMERTTGIEPACENLADFRFTNQPRSHRERAGTEIRTRLARLGRPASRLEKYPQMVVPSHTAAKSRCFRDYRSPRSESNRTRLVTSEVHGHRAARAIKVDTEPTFGIEPNPPRYQRGARPSCCMGRRTAAQLGRGAA